MSEILHSMRVKIIFLVVLAAAAAGIFIYQGKVKKERLVESENAYLRGNQLIKQNQFDAALRFFQLAVEKDPKHVDAHNNLANMLLAKGQVAEAVKHYRKAIELNPGYLEAYNNLGIALGSLRQFQDAIDLYEDVLKRYPRAPEIHNSFGTILAQNGKMEEAKRHFEEAIKLRPDYDRAKQNLELAAKQLAAKS